MSELVIRKDDLREEFRGLDVDDLKAVAVQIFQYPLNFFEIEAKLGEIPNWHWMRQLKILYKNSVKYQFM